VFFLASAVLCRRYAGGFSSGIFFADSYCTYDGVTVTYCTIYPYPVGPQGLSRSLAARLIYSSGVLQAVLVTVVRILLGISSGKSLGALQALT